LEVVDSKERFLIVGASGVWYALPVETVRRVISRPILFPVPGADDRLLGLAQFGGEPLPVVDLGLLVDSRSASDAAREMVVVVAGGDRPMVGLAVDEATQVTGVSGDPGAAIGNGTEGEFRLLDPVSLISDGDEI
jgi:purine-binding chemotaxis protein CheW